MALMDVVVSKKIMKFRSFILTHRALKLCDIWKVRKWVTVSHKNSQDAFKLHQNLAVIQSATIQHNKQEAKSNTGHQQLPSAGGQETPERRDGDDWTQVRHMKVIRDKTKTWRTGHRT